MRWHELHEKIGPIENQEQFDYIFGKVTKTSSKFFHYRVEQLMDGYAIVEDRTDLVVYKSSDLDEIDYLCDHFNNDKEEGKEALMHALKVNKEKYIR